MQSKDKIDIPLPEDNMKPLEIKPPDMNIINELKDVVVEKRKNELISSFKAKLHSYVDRIGFDSKTGVLSIPEPLLDIKGHLGKIFKVE